MVPAEPIVFTLYSQGKFIIRTNLVGPQEYELSGLYCTLKCHYKKIVPELVRSSKTILPNIFKAVFSENKISFFAAYAKKKQLE